MIPCSSSSSFDHRELEILILALRYWRAQRAGQTRKTDPVLSPDEIDLLLEKLGSQGPPSGPSPDSSLNYYPR